jgi:hypothetical protein
VSPRKFKSEVVFFIVTLGAGVSTQKIHLRPAILDGESSLFREQEAPESNIKVATAQAARGLSARFAPIHPLPDLDP